MFLNLMQLEVLNLRLISHSRTSPVLVFYGISVLCVGFFMDFMSLIHWRSMVRWTGRFCGTDEARLPRGDVEREWNIREWGIPARA